MLEIASRDEHSVHVLERQQLLHVLEGTRRAPIHQLRLFGGAPAVHTPQVADGGDLDVVAVLQVREDLLQFAPAVADADVAQRNAVVGSQDTAIGSGRGSQERPSVHESVSPESATV